MTLLSLPKLNDITGIQPISFISLILADSVYFPNKNVDEKYFIPVAKKNIIRVQEGLSPVVYVQSSCNAPSERDLYVKELQKFISIDSYGKCLNNKPLPKQLSKLRFPFPSYIKLHFFFSLEDPSDGMSNEDFFQLMAKYKFTIAFENAIGDDYITEKLWRPLILGSVPIYMGSPSFEVNLDISYKMFSSCNINKCFRTGCHTVIQLFQFGISHLPKLWQLISTI